MSLYKSNFTVSQSGLKILETGRIIKPGESPAEMVERVVNAIADVEKTFSDDQQTKIFAQDLGERIDQKKIIFSTPVLTNAGSSSNKPLSACTIPPISLRDDMKKIRQMVNTYHQEGLGTGFNFDDLEDPLSMLYFLNQVAIDGANSELEDRPVGNMGILSVHHPKIKEFIRAKIDYQTPQWKFNISVNITDEFLLAYKKGGKYQLSDGREYYAEEVFDLITAVAFISADPGLIFMDKMNRDNPVPALGAYQSVAPCAEVGLTPGESCQFGYINLDEFFNRDGIFRQPELETAVRILTRALDNALEINIRNFQVALSSEITRAKRKIGIGVCGVADLLAKLKIPYDSDQGRQLIKDLVVLINYVSKTESMNLAEQRGSFGAFANSLYNSRPGFIDRKYGAVKSQFVPQSDWLLLAKKIRKTGWLRNCSTVSLPPTGRSGLIIDASTGIEPFFNLKKNGQLHPELLRELRELKRADDATIQSILANGGCQHIELPEPVAAIYKTATEIHPQDQLQMVAQLQKGVDESISKTINLSNHTTIDELKQVLLDAYYSGLKGITIYINSRNKNQPIRLV